MPTQSALGRAPEVFDERLRFCRRHSNRFAHPMEHRRGGGFHGRIHLKNSL